MNRDTAREKVVNTEEESSQVVQLPIAMFQALRASECGNYVGL